MARVAPLNIDWKPSRESDRPITEQIVDYMCRAATGPSVRGFRRSVPWPNGSA